MDEIQTAIHEAGHAVAHVRLKLDLLGATITPRRSEESVTLGSVTGEGCAWNLSDAEAQLLANCAGYAACVVAGFDDETSRSGCGDDFDNVSRIIEFWSLEGLNYWLSKSVELMRQPANVRAVRKVADELLTHKTIGGTYIMTLCDWADGACSDDDLAQMSLYCPDYWRG